jgi:uncharacterized membrane protein YvbJ
MEVIRPRVSPGQFCPSCGEALGGDPRFCPSCGTDVRSAATMGFLERRVEQQSIASDPVVPTSRPSPRKRPPWGMIIPIVAAGLVIILLAGWLVSMNGRLNHTKTALQAEQSQVTKLNGKVSSLSSQVDDLTAEENTLQNQNDSLKAALVDCKQAANKATATFKVFIQGILGNASLYDFRTTVNEADRALSLCRTEANSNGAI